MPVYVMISDNSRAAVSPETVDFKRFRKGLKKKRFRTDGESPPGRFRKATDRNLLRGTSAHFMCCAACAAGTSSQLTVSV